MMHRRTVDDQRTRGVRQVARAECDHVAIGVAAAIEAAATASPQFPAGDHVAYSPPYMERHSTMGFSQTGSVG